MRQPGASLAEKVYPTTGAKRESGHKIVQFCPFSVICKITKNNSFRYYLRTQIDLERLFSEQKTDKNKIKTSKKCCIFKHF